MQSPELNLINFPRLSVGVVTKTTRKPLTMQKEDKRPRQAKPIDL